MTDLTIYDGGPLAASAAPALPTAEKPLYARLLAATMADNVQANLEPSDELGIDHLVTVSLPMGTEQPWSIPIQHTDPTTGEVKNKLTTNVIDGVILRRRPNRVYWETEYQESDGSPPQCSSLDMQQGVGTPGGPCAVCPMAQWGSASKAGRGQACSTRTDLFVAVPWQALPVHISAPVTSFQPILRYVSGIPSLVGEGSTYHSVITRLELEPKGKGANAYPIIKLTLRALPHKSELEGLAAYKAGLDELLTRQERRHAVQAKEPVRPAITTTVAVTDPAAEPGDESDELPF